MATYLVAELGNDGPERESSVEGLTVAKLLAQKRARRSEHPVVIRNRLTGEEVARYEPRPKSDPAELDAVIIKLRGATERMQGILQRKTQKRDGDH
jgi:hypothetical protein